MSQLNIVIPMAGEGARFAKAGYTVTKPFIEFNGKMMIEHVLNSLSYPGAAYTLIIRESFETAYPKQLAKLRDQYSLQTSVVTGPTQGASLTALSVHKQLNNAMPLLFADCDNIYGSGVIQRFLDDALERKLDGSLLTFSSTDSRFSFVKLDDIGRAIELKEKDAISTHAICGAYYFSKGEDFVDAAITNVVYGARQEGEYYMSGVYNPLIQNGANIGIYEIRADEWNCVGTPQQLDDYLAKTA